MFKKFFFQLGAVAVMMLGARSGTVPTPTIDNPCRRHPSTSNNFEAVPLDQQLSLTISMARATIEKSIETMAAYVETNLLTAAEYSRLVTVTYDLPGLPVVEHIRMPPVNVFTRALRLCAFNVTVMSNILDQLIPTQSALPVKTKLQELQRAIIHVKCRLLTTSTVQELSFTPLEEATEVEMLMMDYDTYMETEDEIALDVLALDTKTVSKYGFRVASHIKQFMLLLLDTLIDRKESCRTDTRC